MSLAQYVYEELKPPESQGKLAEGQERGAVPSYLFDNALARNAPALLRDFSTPSFFRGMRAHPAQLSVGPAGSGSPFHAHQDAWNALITGTKQWLFVPPPRQLVSTSPPTQWLHRYLAGEHDGGAADSSGASSERPMSCWQRAGDIVYVPDSWSHAVINHRTTLEEEQDVDVGDAANDANLCIAVASEIYPEAL